MDDFDAPAPPTPGQLDVKRISAISLDLDDTLWPVWPTIERAERVLHAWLAKEAPKTAALLVEPGVLRDAETLRGWLARGDRR